MESGGLIRWGRPKKYSSPCTVTLYLDSEIIKELDKQKGSLSRSEYLAMLLKKHGERGIVLRENEELKRRIKKLETANAKLKKKLQEYEERIQLSKERNKTEDNKKNLEVVEQIRNYLTRVIDLENKLKKEWNERRVEELNRKIRRISDKINDFLDKRKVNRKEFWRLVNSGSIEEAIKLLTS